VSGVVRDREGDMFKPDDCGIEIHTTVDKVGERWVYSWGVNTTIQMVIKKPGAIITFFNQGSLDKQCEAIRAFMDRM